MSMLSGTSQHKWILKLVFALCDFRMYTQGKFYKRKQFWQIIECVFHNVFMQQETVVSLSGRNLPVSILKLEVLIRCVHAQSCLTLCGLIDGSPPGSSVHGIFQARILVCVAISCSRSSSQPTSPVSPAMADGFFTTATTRICSIFIFIYLFICLCQVFVAALRIQFPGQGSNLEPLHWELKVLATGPPGKSH